MKDIGGVNYVGVRLYYTFRNMYGFSKLEGPIYAMWDILSKICPVEKDGDIEYIDFRNSPIICLICDDVYNGISSSYVECYKFYRVNNVKELTTVSIDLGLGPKGTISSTPNYSVIATTMKKIKSLSESDYNNPLRTNYPFTTTKISDIYIDNKSSTPELTIFKSMLQLNSHSLLNCIDEDGSFPHIDKTRVIGSPYNITRTFFVKPNDVIPEQYDENEICKLLDGADFGKVYNFETRNNKYFIFFDSDGNDGIIASGVTDKQ